MKLKGRKRFRVVKVTQNCAVWLLKGNHRFWIRFLAPSIHNSFLECFPLFFAAKLQAGMKLCYHHWALKKIGNLIQILAVCRHHKEDGLGVN